MRRALLLVWAVLVLLVLYLATVDGAPAQARPTMLVFHGGGFLLGTPALEQANVDMYRFMGFRAIAPAYPLGDLPAAHRYAVRLAQQYDDMGRVYASGSSAGGGLAAYLARRGHVDGALAVCPLLDYRTWYSDATGAYVSAADPLVRARWSPVTQTGPGAPLRLYASPADTVVPYGDALLMNQRTEVTLRTTSGEHCTDLSWRADAVRYALARGWAP